MNVKHWLRNPGKIVSRLRYYGWERLNPDKPWLCPGTIRFCEKHLGRSFGALEFGSGRSTRWFAARVGKLTSVEHNADWHAIVAQQLAAHGCDNVNYRLIPLNHGVDEPERETYDPLPDYVAVMNEFADGSLDLIVVDGHYRTMCIKACLNKLRPGGLLLVDDTNMW